MVSWLNRSWYSLLSKNYVWDNISFSFNAPLYWMFKFLLRFSHLGGVALSGLDSCVFRENLLPVLRMSRELGVRWADTHFWKLIEADLDFKAKIVSLELSINLETKLEALNDLLNLRKLSLKTYFLDATSIFPLELPHLQSFALSFFVLKPINENN